MNNKLVKLKQAVKARAACIIVRDGLAKRFELKLQFQGASKSSRGLSEIVSGLAPLTGVKLVAIIAVVSVGIRQILLICREGTRVSLGGGCVVQPGQGW